MLEDLKKIDFKFVLMFYDRGFTGLGVLLKIFNFLRVYD